ncbi:MAG TPA: M48 family metalloprotease [Fibrobacteria bacterium]|nr:M48 family metalloprotease [Fibrobacteria bacterium]
MSLLPNSGGRRPLRKRNGLGEHPTPAYIAGLIGVGISTVLLPVSYVAICCGVVRMLGLHLVGNLGWMVGPGAGLFTGLGYLLTGMFLTMLAVFLLRPFLIGRRWSKADLCVTPIQEPRLHAFVLQICTALGSPAPTRIRLSMDVNASARLAPGWRNYWDGSLELVLGLPLIRGLDLGQFAGVLAHELGHFRQDWAMRLAHGIRTVNHWFSRAAAREDAWERDLEADKHRMDPFVYGLCWSARICTWTARQILNTHVRAGQVVSCLLLRQMEHQADGAAIRLVGGETFASMVLEAKVIESAWGLANRSLGMALREGRLADDLPALVAAHTRVFIPEVRRKMERSLLAESTAMFDTHPSLADRVRRARRSSVRGVFHSNAPSHALFTDFAALSRSVTVSFYSRDLGDDFNPSRMMSTSDLVTGQSEVQVGEAAVTGYFLGLLTNLRPLWLNGADLEGPRGAHGTPGPSDGGLDAEDSGTLRKRLLDARAHIEAEYPRAVELYRAFTAADARMLDAVQALTLMRANYWIEPGDFQLRKGGAMQAASAFQEADADQRGIASGLLGFEEAMRVRLASALLLLSDPGVRGSLPDAGSCSHEVTRLLPVLIALGKVQPRLESLRRSFHGMGILLENLDGNEGSPEVDTQLKTHALAIRMDLEAVGTGFAGLEYPFGSVSGSSGLADYALDALPSERDYGAHYASAEETLGRCYALYFRIFGRLALTAGRVEGVLGLGPLQVDH